MQGTTPPIYFSLPMDLSLVDPAWAGCLPDEYGAFDPPRTLHAASALASPDAGVAPSPAASPGSPIGPAHVPATATPGPKNPGENAPKLAHPAPNRADSSTEPDTKQIPDLANSGPPDPTRVNPQILDPPNPAGRPAGPAINSATVAVIVQGLGKGGNEVQASPESAYPSDSVSTGGGDPEGRIGNDPDANPVTYQKADADQSPPGPVQPMPSAVGYQIQGAEEGGVINEGDGNILQPPFSTAGPVLIADKSVVRAPGGSIIIGSLTIPPGSQTTILSHTISAGSSSVLIDSSIYALATSVGATLQQPKTPLAGPVLIAGQSIVRAPNGGLIIGRTTVASGSQLTISGHIFSAGLSSLLIDGSAYALPTSVGAIVQQPADLQAITLAANGAIVSAGGPPAALSGTTYSVASDGRALLASGKTMPFPTKPQSIFTVAGETFTAAPTGFVAAGKTVARDGSAVTIDGTAVSSGPSGTQIGSSSTTTPVGVAEETAAEATLGNLILAAFGTAPRTTNETSHGFVVPFTGGSPRSAANNNIWKAVVCIAGAYAIGMVVG